MGVWLRVAPAHAWAEVGRGTPSQASGGLGPKDDFAGFPQFNLPKNFFLFEGSQAMTVSAHEVAFVDFDNDRFDSSEARYVFTFLAPHVVEVHLAGLKEASAV